MAGTVTCTENISNPSVKLVTIAMTSSAGGAADGSTTYYYSGEILGVVIQPGAGATAPSASWDLTMTGENSVDVLMGQGADLSATTVTAITQCLPVGNSKLTVAATNMGSENSATLQVFIR